MDALMSIWGFLVGFALRLGLMLAIPLALALVATVAVAVGWLARVVARKSQGVEELAGVLFKSDVFYAPGHTWLAAPEGEPLKVGLDDFARRMVSGVGAVRLPAKGAQVRKGEAAFGLALGEKVIDLPSPVSGEVVEVNEALVRDLALLRQPYTKGWLFKVKATGSDHAALPRGEAARTWFRSEQHELGHWMEKELGIAAADGGELLVPGPSRLSPERREALIGSFLKRV